MSDGGDEQQPRSVVVHFHLFKNAGSSVESGLSAFFGPAWRAYDSNDPDRSIDQRSLDEFLSSNPDVSAVSSHQLRPPLDSNQRFRYLPILYLRNPLDRIRSAWEFERRQGTASLSSEVAGESALGEWIDWHRERGSNQCANFHTYALTSLRNPETGGPLRAKPLADHLQAAKDFVSSLPVVGFVEQYDESWAEISNWLGSVFPGFAAPAVHANPTDRRANLEDRLHDMRDMLGVGPFEQLVEENQADLELLEYAAMLRADRER